MRGYMWYSPIAAGAAIVGIALWAPPIVQSHEGHGGSPGHAHNFLTADRQPGQGQARVQQQQGPMERQQSGRPDTRQGSAQQRGDTQPGMQQQGSTGVPGSGGLASGGRSQPGGEAGGGMAGGEGLSGQ